jgi:serine/threonine-protein kinase
VWAKCVGANAQLLSVTPVAPYRVQRADVGPALTTSAIFKHKSDRIRMTVTCAAGQPTAVSVAL